MSISRIVGNIRFVLYLTHKIPTVNVINESVAVIIHIITRGFEWVCPNICSKIWMVDLSAIINHCHMH